MTVQHGTPIEPGTGAIGWNKAGVDIEERPAWAVGAALGIILGIVTLLAGVAGIVWGAVILEEGNAIGAVSLLLGIVLIVVSSFLFSSLVVVSPGEARVVQFFGRYVGTLSRPRLSMVLPLTKRTKVSVKVNNFETHELKVNDADGNPVNIAAIVVWQVADTAKAVFAVEQYANFVAVQSESALRHIATTHPYDSPEGGEESLRGSTEAVAQELAAEVAARVDLAGIKVVETRISSLAYAPEIAQAMLQRQQASAIISAREKIVEGAVSMVNSALERLEAENIVELDEERKATMVSNLLVVLTGDSRVTPVINTGSLYR